MQLRRADTTLGDDQELANVTYNDKYVVVYDFGSVGMWFVPKIAVPVLTFPRARDRRYGIHSADKGPAFSWTEYRSTPWVRSIASGVCTGIPRVARQYSIQVKVSFPTSQEVVANISAG